MNQNICKKHNLAKTLFESHQKPIVKLNTGGPKIYIPKNDSTEVINQNLDILRDTLGFARVEKRSVRSQGEFLESERAVKIIRLRNLQNFGYRNKMGVFLNLEEALYLLETNRLEILWNNVSISIQQGYNLFLDNRLTLHKYRMYKKLVSEGFKVHRFKNSVEEPPTKRIKLDETGIGDKTKEDVNEYVAKDETQVEEITGSLNIKGNPVSCTREDLKNKTNKKIVEFFKKLQNKVPKKCDNTILENDPVYTCTTSKRIDKNINCDVYLVQEEMDPGIGFCKENNKNLFAVISNDDIPFYRFSRVSLPNLLEKEDK